MASLKYWIWLSELTHLGGQRKLALLQHFGGPEEIYYADSGEYLLVEGMTRTGIRALENKDLTAANRILGDCERLGLRVLTMQDADYPDRLRNIFDPPILLYVQGRMPLFDEEVAIAMVGSRRASPYALEMGEKLAFQMAGLGAVIVSGLAVGGDAAAHRGALRANGITVGVIAGGHDIIYPRENRELYEDIAVRGAILSEYPPGTEHLAIHFPVRNRILSGLCQAVVVTEAPERSGTLITASRALDQGRDVFALPGQAGDRHCAGSNLLLREGAGIVTDAWDVLCHYAGQYPHKIRTLRMEEPRRFNGGPQPSGPHAPETNAPEPNLQKPDALKADAPKPDALKPEIVSEVENRPVLDLTKDHGFTDDQLRIVRTIGAHTLQIDDVIEKAQIPARRVLSALTMLELDGYVKQEAGKRFHLTVSLK